MFMESFRKKTIHTWFVDEEYRDSVYKIIWNLHKNRLGKRNWLFVVEGFVNEFNKGYINFMSESEGYKELKAIKKKFPNSKTTKIMGRMDVDFLKIES